MRVGKANGHNWLRLGEAAAALGVSHNTLRHWSDEGLVRCYRSPGGHRRYQRSDIDALLAAPASAETHRARADAGRDGEAWQQSALDALAIVTAGGTGTTSCLVAVQDGDETFRIAAVHGDAESRAVGTRLPFSSLPVESEVVNSGRRLHIPDVARTRLLARSTADEYSRRGARGLLALPIDLGDGRFGVLRLGDSRGPHSFDVDAMTFAELMAHHAGILLTGRPHQDARTPHTRGGAHARASGAPPALGLSTQALALDDDLPAAAQAAVDALGGGGLACVTVYALLDGRAHALASSASAPLTDWRIHDLLGAAAVADGGNLELVRRDDARLTHAARVRFFDDRGVTALVHAPVAGSDRIVGFVEAAATHPGALGAAVPAIRAVASLLSSTLGAAKEHAALQREERDVPLLRELWQQDTSSLGGEQVLRDLVERLAHATRAPIVEVYGVEGDTARALVSFDGGRWDSAWEDVVLRLERYPSSLRAVETGEAVLINGLDDAALDADGRFSMERWGYQSHLAVPLIAGGRTLGLLELYDYVPHDFTPDLELARAVGRIAALTLANERLLEQVRRRNRMISELEAIAALCAAATDVGALAAQVAERLRVALDAASCQIFRLTARGLLCLAGHDRSGPDEEAVGLLTDLDEHPTAVRALDAQGLLVISAPGDQDLSHADQAALRANGWAVELCVPLLPRRGPAGLIDIVDSRSRGFAEYADFLRSVAAAFTLALESFWLEDELGRRPHDPASMTALDGETLRRLAPRSARTSMPPPATSSRTTTAASELSSP